MYLTAGLDKCVRLESVEIARSPHAGLLFVSCVLIVAVISGGLTGLTWPMLSA